VEGERNEGRGMAAGKMKEGRREEKRLEEGRSGKEVGRRERWEGGRREEEEWKKEGYLDDD
jgi:hypothetical protein